ncbi:hypothetical protein [Mesorhizobium sp. M0030]|uniref:hypothetical protein n=1 Tax=Mesorhizobium sp. M0030 TaxID=2956851 RepID=UPI00333BB97A
MRELSILVGDVSLAWNMEVRFMGGRPDVEVESKDTTAGLLAKAKEAIRADLGKVSRYLFVLERSDHSDIGKRLSDLELPERNQVRIITNGDRVSDAIEWCDVVFVFCAGERGTAFRNEVVEQALAYKRLGVCVRLDGGIIPEKITAYRWKVYGWRDFLDLISIK